MYKYFSGSPQNLLDLGAKIILEPPETFDKIPENSVLICMIDAPIITSVWCDSKDVLDEFTRLWDKRFKLWFLLDRYTAEEHFK
jgi:hypothetical protein